MLHATNMDTTSKTNTTHKSLVFLVCDCFIVGTFNKIPSMTMSDIKKRSYKLGVKWYDEFNGETLHKDLVEQHHMSSFPGMLLSNRACKVVCGQYSVCKQLPMASQLDHFLIRFHTHLQIKLVNFTVLTWRMTLMKSWKRLLHLSIFLVMFSNISVAPKNVFKAITNFLKQISNV